MELVRPRWMIVVQIDELLLQLLVECRGKPRVLSGRTSERSDGIVVLVLGPVEPVLDGLHRESGWFTSDGVVPNR